MEISLAEDDRRFECKDGDTLLRAALRAGLPFPYECNVGGCGSCKFQLESGEVDNLWEDAPAISERDRRRERRLACQSVPRGDCTLRVRIPEGTLAHPKPALQSVTLVDRYALTHDLSEFHFRSAGPAVFRPGQYALLDIEGVEGVRAYSMSNLPNESGIWQFQIRRVPDGAATTALFDALSEGAAVSLDAPFGHAYWRAEVARDVVCIAGGSGLAPMVSVARAFAEDPADRSLRFFYGGRGPEDVCGEDLLAELPGYGERIQYQAAISMPELDRDSRWRGPTGWIHEVALAALGEDAPRFEYYLAGPPAMAQASLRALVTEAHVPSAQIHYDLFY